MAVSDDRPLDSGLRRRAGVTERIEHGDESVDGMTGGAESVYYVTLVNPEYVNDEISMFALRTNWIL